MKILKRDLIELYKDVNAENRILWDVLERLNIKIDIKEKQSMYMFGYITQTIKFEGNGESCYVARELSEDIQRIKRSL